MKFSRRHFLAAAGFTLAATGIQTKRTAADSDEWSRLRAEFDLSHDFIHLASFFIASHPRPVREAIERHRMEMDRNPFQVVEHGLFGSEPGDSMTDRVRKAAAEYLGARPEEIALTGNTTSGLALIYHGLQIKKGQEILTTAHDHYSHHESIRLAAERSGASVRKIALFESFDAISADSIVQRIRAAIQDNTRAIGVTWVHSSSGLKLPVRRIADLVAEANKNRDESDRILLIVDGVHGLGVENETVGSLGMDFLAAGTHKWIFGPRGTGIIWGSNASWASLRPTIPSFEADEPIESWITGKPVKNPTRAAWVTPGGFHAYEHQWAVADAFRFHLKIGKKQVADRIHALNTYCKDGLATIRGVKLYTPRTPELSAGIICFDVEGKKPEQVVKSLLAKKIIASTTPYAVSYARLAPSLVNNPAEIDTTLKEIQQIANS
jgi:selenocysteine lyase/cysteine desulfurase